jgi:hypothetical protein
MLLEPFRLLGQLQDTCQGSSKEHYNPYRTNVIRNLGRAISGLSASGLEKILEKQVPAINMSELVMESVNEIKSPINSMAKFPHLKGGRDI